MSRSEKAKFKVVEMSSGKSYVAEGVESFCRDHGLNPNKVREVMAGHRKSYRGYQFKRMGRKHTGTKAQPVKVSFSGETRKFPSIAAASKEIGLHINVVRQIVKGKYAQYKGFKVQRFQGR